MISDRERFDRLMERQNDMLGNGTIGRSVTATLHVSPNGSNADGLSWRTAYTTIQVALNAASTDASECTLILIAPHETNYDINMTGEPTWAANVILQGVHRNWSKVVNNHAGATAILKLTGKSAVCDLNFNLGTANDGLIMSHGGVRVCSCQFSGIDLTSAAIGLKLENALAKHAKLTDCDFRGNVTYMTALEIDNFGYGLFKDTRVHDCLVGVHILGANARENLFFNTDIGDSVTAIDIDAGDENHFYRLILHHNTTNIDDVVGDHIYMDVLGQLEIAIQPDNLVGITVNTGGAGAWGADTEILPAASRTKPFRIVGVHVEPSTSELYQMRFSADSGASYYDVVQFDGTKREGSAAPSGTEYIFNVGIRISASTRDVSGGDNVKVWIEVQEI